jgi:cell fate regulator YaaT (PSP1 superfamily)
MGCSSCGTAAGGKPSGCKSNGGCSTGGCNRLNVFNWLSDLPLHDGAKPYSIMEVSVSKGSRKEFYRNNTNYLFEKNDWITVEGVGGVDIGQVSLTGELVKLQMKKYSVSENSVTKRVLHPATDDELEVFNTYKAREQETMVRARAIAKQLNLEMKLAEVEIQADGKKGTFFYTADQRVDFRELIKHFAGDFKMKIEMRQIGARQESAKVGGIGSCGRELCCSTWLSDFKSVNVGAARYQNLSINQAKLSGQCGRLKCCLNYELDTYLDALSVFPTHADHLDTTKGTAYLQKRDIFKNLMWYSYSDNNKQYPLSITRVKEILKINKQGQKADDLQPVELEVKHEKGGVPKAVDMGFINDVGQITLKNLEKGNKKKRQGSKPQNRERPVGDPGSIRDQNSGTENRQRPTGDNQQRPPRPPRPQGEGAPKDASQPRPNRQPQNGQPREGQRPQQGPRTEGQPRSQEQRQPRPNNPQGQNRQRNNPEQSTAPSGESINNGEANPVGDGNNQQARHKRPGHGNRPDHRNRNRPERNGPRGESAGESPAQPPASE